MYFISWFLYLKNWISQNLSIEILGKNPADAFLEGMMNDAPGPINFTMFLTLFGEKLQGTDPEDVIRNAFACFDEENTGCLHEEKLRELLSTMGERFSEEDVSYIFFLH